MRFKVIDTKTGKEPTSRVIQQLARKGHLCEFDIDGFYVGEEGYICLMDDCGKAVFIDCDRFKVEIIEPERKKGKWVHMVGWWECNQCHAEYTDMPTCMGKVIYEYCPMCGVKMEVDE